MYPPRFTDASTSFELAYTGSYSVPLVILSVFIAILAAFASISHVDLMRATQSASVRFRWHLIGAVAMGPGSGRCIFSAWWLSNCRWMFISTPGMTLVSVFPAIAAGYIALSVLYSHKPGAAAIVAGGALMGLGIGVMHYLGMSGMRIEARMLYQPGLFILSIIVAVVMAASAALSAPRLMVVMLGESHSRRYGFYSSS